MPTQTISVVWTVAIVPSFSVECLGVSKLVGFATRVTGEFGEGREFVFLAVWLLLNIIIVLEFTLGILPRLKGLSKHRDNVFSDRIGGPVEFPPLSDRTNFIILAQSAVHKILTFCELALVEVILASTDPPCPRIRLKNFCVDIDGVLYPFKLI